MSAAAAAAAAGACLTCGVDDDDGLLCDGCDAAGVYTRPFLSST